MKFDAIIIGSGAGGSAAAYQLVQSGLSVLLIEKGLPLPHDGSTLDVDKVLRQGMYLADEPWLDSSGATVMPEEHFNLGGKTKWYGAALLRFAPHEFGADAAHQCRAWPFTYGELEPFYEEAEELLGVRTFPIEPGLHRLFGRLRRRDPAWTRVPLNLGLAGDILDFPEEARRFDAFASARNLKRDAETAFLDRVKHRPNLRIVTGKAVAELMAAPGEATRAAGVVCEDGSTWHGEAVLIAAGALHSPRLLEHYFAANELVHLPAYRSIGRHYKAHALTALLAFSHRRVDDVLNKTALLVSERFPHSSVQTLGGSLAVEIVATQAPRWLPRALAEFVGRRAVGLFLQTEDGSHAENRIRPGAAGGPLPRLDFDLARVAPARAEHRALVRELSRQLASLGYLPVARPIPVTGTAHACGTLVTGHDPADSVVDADGKVHGLQNVYVVDGSVLPRSSRVNPALTIYAWALRVASRLTRERIAHEYPRAAQLHPVRT